MEITGTAALITGGRRGLGRALAEALTAAGARVVLVARHAEPCGQVDHLGRLVPGDEGAQGPFRGRPGLRAHVTSCPGSCGKREPSAKNADLGRTRARHPAIDGRVGAPPAGSRASPTDRARRGSHRPAASGRQEPVGSP